MCRGVSKFYLAHGHLRGVKNLPSTWTPTGFEKIVRHMDTNGVAKLYPAYGHLAGSKILSSTRTPNGGSKFQLPHVHLRRRTPKPHHSENHRGRWKWRSHLKVGKSNAPKWSLRSEFPTGAVGVSNGVTSWISNYGNAHARLD